MAEWPGSIRDAVAASGLKNGARISFHHHLRLGDRVLEQVLPELTAMGFRDLILCASSLMGSAGETVLHAVRAGTVSTVETTGLKEPMASAVCAGELPNPVVFRSHGGRAREIISGRTPIDTAFLAVSAVDRNGNANGVDGPSRFGSLGYGIVDARFARHVILLTDYISPEPLERVSIPAEQADQIVTVKTIGDIGEIAGGSLRLSKRPLEHLIAEQTVRILKAAGTVKAGFNFQAGSGGISLLAAVKTAELMRKNGIIGGFASGGATGTLASLVREGLFEKLYDVQSFDDEAAVSLKNNPNHLEMDASLYANPDHPGGCIAGKLDVMILSATEADRDFNINSLTGGDGRILGALGGAPDTAAGAALTVAALPSFRGRIPTIRERVRTICTPGSTVDVIVTERGCCVNPRRGDLFPLLNQAGIEILQPEELRERVHKITGIPAFPGKGKKTVGVVEYRDGRVLDKICIS